ncbi:MAG TPA: DUF192 domain-containing protein [Flavobacteriaceae bacterium]|nr:DUF192 domain-containing protein [Flavobacteriaceae bacterium]HPF11342.1 DUF192 domain-containing protein [Flavobacteriaceae bacterium]HQU20505.1 DUF192 domain-containing protein [Flavobacteriaceae bacterium]HQU65862.1 DUF192 domain-containing protein [Flavobacteriaceae bacterium]HRW44160.1 DUF192 domain-containing protein [Flavobacteriaceae bacterium]
MKEIIFSGLILASSFVGCHEKNNKILTKEVTFKKEGELILKKASNDSILANLDIEIADTDYETQTGLMYRKNMQSNRGMLFIFPEEDMRYFYMKNTEFPLDIIYLDASMKVVSIQKNAKPYDQTSLPSEGLAKYTLEVNAGLTDQWGLQAGDFMSFKKITP